MPAAQVLSGPATDDGSSVTFIGNATVLLRFAGMTILTDPNFVPAGERVPIGYGLGTTRLKGPAMAIDELPALDAVLLSHFHGDHFDRIAKAELDRDLPIITTPQAASQLDDLGFRATRPLRTWQTHDLHGPGQSHIRVTSMPGRHAPGLLSRALPQVMGELVECWPDRKTNERPALRIYITGDTLMYEGIRAIPERYPDIDLALLHLGGTRVMGLTVTMDAEQGVEMLRTIRPTLAVPIHVDDYDAFQSTMADLAVAVERAGLRPRVRTLDRGGTLDLTSIQGHVPAG